MEEKTFTVHVFAIHDTDRGKGFEASGGEPNGNGIYSGFCSTIPEVAKYAKLRLGDRISENKNLKFDVVFTPRKGDHIHVSRFGKILDRSLSEDEINEFWKQFTAKEEAAASA